MNVTASQKPLEPQNKSNIPLVPESFSLIDTKTLSNVEMKAPVYLQPPVKPQST